jgi:hypothetical protein
MNICAVIFKLDLREKEMPKIATSKDNLVRIYVWIGKNEMDSHVSLATFGNSPIYASHWPDWRSSDSRIKAHPRADRIAYVLYGQFLNSAPPRSDASFERDLSFKEHLPNFIIDFYSLDVKKISELHGKIKLVHWAKSGSETYTCATIVSSLLQEGGSICADFDSSLRRTFPFVVTPSRLHPHAAYYADRERKAFEIIDSHDDRLPAFPKRSYDNALEFADYVEANSDPTSEHYMRLVCFGDKHGISLSDTKILYTGANLEIISRPLKVHVVKDVIYLKTDEIMRRLKASIVSFRKWDWNKGWNEEHFARLVTTDQPISYKTRSLFFKGPRDFSRDESRKVLLDTLSKLGAADLERRISIPY